MQFYLNGYAPGDPDILPQPSGAAKRSTDLPAPSTSSSSAAARRDAARGAALPFPASAPGSSSVATVRSSSARRTASRAAPWKCSRLSGWARKLVPRSLLGQRDRVLAPVARGPLRGSCAQVASRTPRTACRSSARHREPGAHAGSTCSDYCAKVADPARTRLRPWSSVGLGGRSVGDTR
jgi:hypothetical protein